MQSMLLLSTINISPKIYPVKKENKMQTLTFCLYLLEHQEVQLKTNQR